MTAETGSVWERVARAIGDARWGPGEWLGVPDAQMLRAADAALVAVADDPGLVGALRGHEFLPISNACRCSEERNYDHAAHLADVIRAWLRGQA